MKPERMASFLALNALLILLLSGCAAAGTSDLSSTSKKQVGDLPASEPLVLTDSQASYPLGLYLEILEDAGGELTIADVASAEYASRWLPSRDVVPNFGFTDSVIWVRLNLSNDASQVEQWLLELGFPNMHFVDLYSPSEDSRGFSVSQTGVSRPLATRDFLYPRIVFKLTIPNQTQQTYYLRFQNGASMTLPLTLWAQDAFWVEAQYHQMLNWLFYGALAALLVYHLFLLFSLRELRYLYFVILLFSILLEELVYDGYLEVYFFPGLFAYKNLYYPLLFIIVIASLVLFSDEFLELKTQYPRLHRTNLVILAGGGIWVILIPFLPYRQLALLVLPWALISLGSAVIASTVAWRKSYHPARFFMIAWFGMLASIIIVLVVRLGVLPSTLFTENAYRFGMIWVAVCWAIALADRINLLKAETDSANRALRDSEHKLSQILEGMPLGVVVYGQNQKPRYSNKRVSEILGNPARGILPDISAERTLAEAMGYFSFRVTGSDQPYPLDRLPVYRALHGETASADDIEADLVDKRVPLEIWASPVEDTAGNIEAAVVAFRDITLRKKISIELDGYRRNLEELVGQRTKELSSANDQLQREVAERKILETFLSQRIAWLSELKLVRQAIHDPAGLPAAYERLSGVIQQLLDALTIFIVCWDGDANGIDFTCYSNHSDGSKEIKNITTLFQPGAALRDEIARGELICLALDQADRLPASLLAECFNNSLERFLLLAPLTVRNSTIGVLGMTASLPLQDLQPAQIDLIGAIAFDLADLDDEVHLLEQSRALIAAEERNRLARDLHDSVTQVLFSASLVAEVIPQIWRRNPDKALKSLEDLRLLTRGALAEMRTMLLELRPSAVIKTPLGELLAQLTEAITSRTNLPFDLYLEQIDPLPEDVHTTFYRIAQEALNNVVKHAQARRATVTLTALTLQSESDNAVYVEVRLVIADDGVGFSEPDSQPGRLGIGIMRERAAAIDAILSVISQPGYGTLVELSWSGDTRSLS